MIETSSRKSLAVGACLAAGSAVVLACVPAQYFGRQQDDVLYVLASQALAAGHYHLTTAVGRPPFSMITPGFPALLLPLSWLCPERIGCYGIFAALLQAALPWAVYAWARKRLPTAEAVMVSLLSVAHPVLLSQAGAVMSETPYLLVMLLMLALLERPRTPAAAAGACLLALTQLRPAALSLLPAAAAPFARKPKAKDAARLLAPAALAAAAWTLWSRRAAGSVQELGEFRISYAGQGLARPLWSAWDNARYYAEALGAAFLPHRWAETGAAAALGGALLLCGAAGIVRAFLRKKDDPAAWALAGTAGMHAVWAWRYERYWIPALPLLWWACAVAWGRAGRWILGGLLAAVAAFSVPVWVAGTSWRTPELARTYAWLSSHMPPSDGLVSAEYLRDGFYAGRPSAPLADAPNAASLARSLRSRRLRYVLWQERLDVGVSPRHELRRRIERAGRHLEDRSLFTLIHAEPTEGGRVYLLK